jgi:CRISPR-associated endonuclease Csn1
MAVAKTLYEEELTPGEYCYQILKSGKKHLPDFYRSDLKAEFETGVESPIVNFTLKF